MEQTFITEIKINQVRHLKDLTIKLSDAERKHLILTGKNGSGKTSLLEIIGKQIGVIKISGFPDFKLGFISSNSISNENLGIKFSNSNSLAIVISSNNLINKSYFHLDRKLQVYKSQGVLDEITNKVEDFEKFLAKKRTEQAFMSFEKSNKEKVDQITKWFEKLELNLQYLFEDNTLRIASKRTEDKVEFKLQSEFREEFDFNTLASGYSSLLFILFSIIQQMENDISFDYNKEGIVLIDEIEAHLHISLQKKILPFLTSFFPNVQFIVTTHSPFVLQSEPNAVIYDLETKMRFEDFSSFSSETIVETYFDSDKFSTALKDKMAEYEKLLSNGVKDKDKIKEMRNKFYKIPDFEVNFWIKDLDIKYREKLKPILHD